MQYEVRFNNGLNPNKFSEFNITFNYGYLQIERVIPVAGKSELTGFGFLFYSKTRRNLSDGHLWFSVFARPSRSTFTRCQRATCCLSLLFCSMMANIFFYGIDLTTGSGTSPNICCYFILVLLLRFKYIGLG